MLNVILMIVCGIISAAIWDGLKAFHRYMNNR